ncbi:TetR/AcrR family transcriptional regulator [Crossiella sp. SN42]|uniref:TetR/AcrR family transcriptional regulator n=1 Tax=Crossiella sp. SN42 TaxID=2944808 RepID=UPI00207CED97|nr:TetR/AcrR family transcriptional regulator [Crossiella sp. SN42]MCO1579146.1 TetR/AcrR family transcriptional regulator [Crossiella sp. SN42]
MDQPRVMPAPRTRRTRAEQKRETRDALIEAGLVVFSRDGYHGAALDGIANEAGFSKGAVYSNFSSKAELFLAVLDYNLGALRGEGWDPLASATTAAVGAPGTTGGDEREAEQLVRGFGLATLEFITTAARDDMLIPALRTRVQMLLDAYGRVAATHRAAEEDLAVDKVAQLMAALDQGASVLALSGVATVDGSLMRSGLRRLLGLPADAVDERSADRAGRASLLPTVEQVQRLIRDEPGDLDT